MAVEKLTRERRREMTRVALLDAAVEVFAKRGFEGASLDEIAEAAGFTRGAIYKNFANKEELFFAVLDRANEEAFASFGAVIAENSSAKYANTWRALMPQDANIMALGLEFRLYAMRHPDPAVRERFLAQQKRSAERIGEFIKEAQEERRVAYEMPAELPALLMALANGISQETLTDPDAVRLFEPFFALLLKALAPD
jgi:AcrR family transcriptional regulator